MAKLTCEQVTELLPEYVLGALSPAEAADVQAHVAQCADCRAALADYEAVTEGLLYAAPPRSAPAYLEADLRRRIQAATAPVARPARAGWRERLAGLFRPRLRYATIAALAAAALLMITNVYWIGMLKQLQAQQASLTQQAVAQQAALDVLAGGGRSIALKGDAANPQAKGVCIFSPEQDRAVLIVDDLPELPADRTYQLWLVHNGKRDSGGLFTVDAQGQGTLIVRAPQSLEYYDSIGVTVEPLGGSAAPTTPRVMGAIW